MQLFQYLSALQVFLLEIKCLDLLYYQMFLVYILHVLLQSKNLRLQADLINYRNRKEKEISVYVTVNDLQMP
jgi:molecular chaperone GrpE (heat shock protein)